MKTIAAILLTASLAVSAFAGGLSQTWKEWPHSAQAYFMTNAERAQWSSLKTDAEAEQFVNDFIARRGGEEFVKEVAHSVEQCDKYLSIGKTPGSLTARGKMMILLGPAAPANVTKKKKAGDVQMGPGMPEGGMAGPTMGDMQSAANGPGSSEYYVTEYTYSYPGTALPAAYGKPLTVKIEVDPAKEKDRYSSLGADRELDKLYEMVAQARLAAAKPATP